MFDKITFVKYRSRPIKTKEKIRKLIILTETVASLKIRFIN